MTYLAFDLLLVALPALLLLAGTAWRPLVGPFAVLAPVALLWTAPWDEHLVRTGVWDYAPDAVLARVGSVPAEEYGFVVLEVLLVGAWAVRTGALTAPAHTAASAGRRSGAVGWLAVTAAGIALAAYGGPLRYLGLLLLWTGPPMALQRAVAGDVLVARRRARAAVALPCALWLCLADRLALADGIWAISPASSTGVLLLGLPLEEALFFVLTCVLVTDGLLLAADPAVRARAGVLVPVLVRSGRGDDVVADRDAQAGRRAVRADRLEGRQTGGQGVGDLHRSRVGLEGGQALAHVAQDVRQPHPEGAADAGQQLGGRLLLPALDLGQVAEADLRGRGHLPQGALLAQPSGAQGLTQQGAEHRHVTTSSSV